mmetsp:Transcript_8657/g.16042  ORF Transcript_8657/g.16042 Transcript_8657/m.16042 type:complete len:240 (+) Transcript_8657:1409-2128(+)
MFCQFLFLLQPLLPCLLGFCTFLVLVRSIPHGLHGVVVKVQAEHDPRVERLLRLKGGVDVTRLRCGDPLVGVVDLGVDRTVPYCLCYDALDLLHAAVQPKHLGNVRQADSAVRLADVSQTRPDHVVLEPDDQVVGLVLEELIPVLLGDPLEGLQVSLPDGLGKAEVRLQRPSHSRSSEVGSLWNLPQKQVHHAQPLVESDSETFGSRGRLPQRLLEVLLALRVVQLDRSDPPHVVQVSA